MAWHARTRTCTDALSRMRMRALCLTDSDSICSLCLFIFLPSHTGRSTYVHDARRRVSATSGAAHHALSTRTHDLAGCECLWPVAWHAHACAHDTCMRSLACACALLCLAHSDSICSLLSVHLLAMYVTHTRGRFHMMRVVVSRPHRRRPSISRSRHTNTRSRRR